MKPRKFPSSPSLERGEPTKPMRNLILVFCEGATEEKLLNQLRQHWHVPNAKVKVVGQQGVPKSVVQAAKSTVVQYKEDKPRVVVVFDRDEHDSWAAALIQAEALGYTISTSNPCIELWGLLLHREQSAEIHRHVAQRALAKVHPKYDHHRNPYFDLPTVLQAMDLAKKRAIELDRRAEDAGDPRGNPTTRFYLAYEAFQPHSSPA